MFKLAKPFFIIVETPLHAGTGNDLGVVDLPIQRERHTDFPKIEGSGLKGSIREVFEELVTLDEKKKKYVLTNNSEPVKKLRKKFPNIEDEWKKDKEDVSFIKFQEAVSLTFGPENPGNDGHAGALGFTDARTLLFPVKSMRGVFAWITCPKVLERFKKDLSLCKDIDIQNMIPEISELEPDECVVCKDKTAVTIESDGKKYVILEEYTFKVKMVEDKKSKILKGLVKALGGNRIAEKLVILHDEAFKDFVNLSTEVITRTKIDNATGTVKDGHLFTEEYLPCETILYSLSLTTPIFHENKGVFAKKSETDSSEEEKVMDFFTAVLPEVMQIGGNATIGKGIVSMKIFHKEQKNAK